MGMNTRTDAVQNYLYSLEQQLKLTTAGSEDRAGIVELMLRMYKTAVNPLMKAGLMTLAIKYEPEAVDLIQIVPQHVEGLVMSRDFRTAAKLLRASVDRMIATPGRTSDASKNLIGVWAGIIFPLAQKEKGMVDVSADLFEMLIHNDFLHATPIHQQFH